MQDLRYIYAVGRVRVLETRLLKKDVFLNLLGADKLGTSLKMLTEMANYPLDILNIKNSLDVNNFIRLERQKLKELSQELFVDSFLFEAYIDLKKDLSRSRALILKAKSEFLKDFIQRFIDLYNIKTFFRINYQRESAETLRTELLEGGYIPKAEFINPSVKPWGALYQEAIKDGLMQIEKEGNFSLLERQIEDYLTNLLRPAKYMFFGPEAIFAYCLAKENELKRLCLVLLAKINNISHFAIQERMTLTYA